MRRIDSHGAAHRIAGGPSPSSPHPAFKGIPFKKNRMARTSSLDTEIRSRIETFLAEISTMVRDSAFQAVREALGGEGGGSGGNGAPARRGPGRPRGSGAQANAGAASGNGRKKAGRRGSRGGKRSSEEMDAMTELIELHIRQSPGQGAEQIGKAVGLSTKDMALPIRKLLAARSIRTEGQRRGTKYFAGGGLGSSGGGGRKAKAQRKSKGARKRSRKGGRKGARASSAAGKSAPAAAA
jgi:hypothetical protein